MSPFVDTLELVSVLEGPGPRCPSTFISFRQEGLLSQGSTLSVPVPGRPFLCLAVSFSSSASAKRSLHPRSPCPAPWNCLSCCCVRPPCPESWQHLPRLSGLLSASGEPFGFRSCFCFLVVFPFCRGYLCWGLVVSDLFLVLIVTVPCRRIGK